ncbi:MAG TPA: GNAT family N-acetyltransferase [Phycisphaerales bacterium]|nr:GNAT family N-acetyltransferase [Phycisphaerales bacterium]HMP37002.1 GNAT family N-acetyltransferase [Phycisphaerales bacterium]
MSLNADFCPSLAALGEHAGRRIGRHLLAAMRSMLAGPGVRHGRGFAALVTGAPHPFGNFAVLSDGDDSEAVTAATDLLLACSAPTALIFAAAPAGPHVDERLGRLGFHSTMAMPAMAIEIDSLAATHLPRGCAFERIDDRDEASWATAFVDGYGLPQSLRRSFGGDGRSPEGTLEAGVDAGMRAGSADAASTTRRWVERYGITMRGRVVCTSLICVDDGLAGVYCVATLPEARRCGLGGHATAEALRCARALGCRVGVLQSSLEGRSLYARLGFVELGALPVYLRMPADAPTLAAAGGALPDAAPAD